MFNDNDIENAIAPFGIAPIAPDLGIERNRVKEMLAEVRAIANPRRYRKRLKLAQPITRNVWVRWCAIEGVESGLPFYRPDDIRKLVRTCLWFARGGTQAQLEEIIIQEEMDAYENAA